MLSWFEVCRHIPYQDYKRLFLELEATMVKYFGKTITKTHLLGMNEQFLTISIAIEYGNRNILELILEECIVRKDRKYRNYFISYLPSLLAKYPDLVVDILNKIPLEKAHPQGTS